MRTGREGSAKVMINQSNEQIHGDQLLPETEQKQNLKPVTVQAGPWPPEVVWLGAYPSYTRATLLKDRAENKFGQT